MARHCCLILEDQALIGLALEASLNEAGFEIAGPFERSSEALNWLRDRTPDLAVIDVLLKDGPCLPVARELRRKRVPFAIYSGLKPPTPTTSEFQDVPWLQKPISREELCMTLQKLAQQVSVIGLVPPEHEAVRTLGERD